MAGAKQLFAERFAEGKVEAGKVASSVNEKFSKVIDIPAINQKFAKVIDI